MTLKLPLHGRKAAIVISAYAPIMTNPDDIKEKLYRVLHCLTTAVPKIDNLIILGDFDYCAEHGLLITNTTFRLSARNRTSLLHPRSGHWHLIDFVIIRKRDRQDVRVTKSMCGADCWTDHRLIISKMKIRILPKRRPQGKLSPKRLNILQLKKRSVREELVDSLDVKSKYIEIMENIEETWSRFRDTVYVAASKILGPNKRKHQDWFDENNEEITRMPEEKNRLFRAYTNNKSQSRKAVFYNIRSTVQRKLRETQNTWLSQKADEIQSYPDRNDMKRFYDAIKSLHGPQPSSSSPWDNTFHRGTVPQDFKDASIVHLYNKKGSR
ncbi:hypothetical protein EGW08_023323 [Elysia chlorotica]|uniref:Endonuclease/exonuclease/phosphatase domain-containing protein n=1 Tax=Elysia chlorotica TaxID=188477 RepID=A0A433SIU4_ELYCH|nr:hypothetical protein EGW08_023323 [Elysia chlorotica]